VKGGGPDLIEADIGLASWEVGLGGIAASAEVLLREHLVSGSDHGVHHSIV